MSRLLGGTVEVRVPGSSANLGPGFDCLGIALTLYDIVQVRVSTHGLTIAIAGEGSAELPHDSSHLVIQTMYATFHQLGVHPDGLSVSCKNSIPQARGMGSSAAAATAGVLAARALVRDGSSMMSDDEVLRVASRVEKHPDNVASCLLGGFTLAWIEDAGAQAVRIRPHDRITPFVYVPVDRGLTEQARAVLPGEVAQADAAFNTQRSALLVHALTSAPELLLEATQDRLHQPYRAANAPGSADLISELRRSGFAAVLSGAGPSVLVLGVDDVSPPKKAGWELLALAIDHGGATVTHSNL